MAKPRCLEIIFVNFVANIFTMTAKANPTNWNNGMVEQWVGLSGAELILVLKKKAYSNFRPNIPVFSPICRLYPPGRSPSPPTGRSRAGGQHSSRLPASYHNIL